eukprot:TRINITY_DN15487_c0_g3_i1.p3 TRINITY_DN15487_c0_g3~~TRINITY_DN15487_c0_g3_i1.p3  ORF type:complete len:106 (-),score=18.63 TRINITY_DN15487_c0_g3_i1:1109-1426(-)
MVRLDVGQFRYARARHIDQCHRIVVQPDRLLLRLPRGRIVAQPLPCFVVQRDLSRTTGRLAQHAFAAMVLGVAFLHGITLLHRVHAVGITAGKRSAARAWYSLLR